MCSLQENQVFRLIVNKIKFRRYRTRLGRGAGNDRDFAYRAFSFLQSGCIIRKYEPESDERWK